MSVKRIDMDKFSIYHSDILNGDIELIITSDMNNQCYIALSDFTKANIELVGNWAVNTLKDHGYSRFKKEVTIIVKDEEEYNKVQDISFGNDVEVVVVKAYEEVQVNVNNNPNDRKHDNKNDEKDGKVEDFIESYLKVNTINKMDNGIMKKYVQRISSDASNSYMLEDVSAVDIHNKYQELLSDEKFRNKIVGMNEEEIAKEVLDSISLSGNKKQYYLESSLEQGSSNKKEELAGDVAYQKDGVVNKEIGIVQNGPSNGQQYSSIEQDGDNLNVVNPELQSTSIYSNGNVNGDSSSLYNVEDSYKDDFGTEEYMVEEENVQNREVENKRVKVRKRVLEKNAGLVSIFQIIFIIMLIGVVFMFLLFNR